MGKWDQFRDELPRGNGVMVDEETPAEQVSEWQNRVNALKGRYAAGEEVSLDDVKGVTFKPAGLGGAALAADYKMLRLFKDRLEASLKLANVYIAAQEQMLGDQYEAEGVTSLSLAGGGKVRTHVEPYPHVADPEKFRQWCLAQGMERDMKLHPSKAIALVKRRLEAGEPDPPGVQTFLKTKVSFDRE